MPKNLTKKQSYLIAGFFVLAFFIIFTPKSNAQEVRTDPPTEVLDTSARLNGRINPNNIPGVRGFFVYDNRNVSCANMANRIPGNPNSDTSFPIDNNFHPYSRLPQNLQENTTYFYCAAVRYDLLGELLVEYGERRSFTTLNTNDVSGYAWSSNIGWLSFNCYNEGRASCVQSYYGVDVEDNGDFFGHAWSSNIGWVSFNQAETGAPPNNDPCGANCIARLNGTNLTGWARAISQVGKSDGWDGWIRFNGHTNPVTLNTSITPGEFTGYAWGDDVTGWVSMNCADEGVCDTSDYKTIFGGNEPPTTTADDVEFTVTQGPTTCANDQCAAICSSNMRFSWTFLDEDGDDQSAYQLQVDDNSDFSSPRFDSGKTPSVIARQRSVTIGADLNFNSTYFWRIKVWDEHDAESDWYVFSNNTTPHETFNTSPHAYPSPSFSWSPSRPSAEDETVRFTDQSTFSNNPANRLFDWTFEDGTPPTHSDTVSGHTVDVIFATAGSKTISLTATDSELAGPWGNGQCRAQHDAFRVQLPIPDFEEVPPTSFWQKTKNLFANLFKSIFLSPAQIFANML